MESKVMRLPGTLPAGIVDLSTIVPRSQWVPVYHVGPGGCRQVALYFIRRPKLGESVTAGMTRLADGTIPDPQAMIVCGACGKPIAADHVRKTLVGLSLDEPEPLPLARKYKTGRDYLRAVK